MARSTKSVRSRFKALDRLLRNSGFARPVSRYEAHDAAGIFDLPQAAGTMLRELQITPASGHVYDGSVELPDGRNTSIRMRAPNKTQALRKMKTHVKRYDGWVNPKSVKIVRKLD